MKAMDTPYCLVLPVDVPQLPVEMLEELLLVHEDSLGERPPGEFRSFGDRREGSSAGKPLLLVHGERTEPLMGIYPVCMADCIGEQIEKASAPVFRVLDAWGFDTFRTSAEEWKMRNINTPEDYRELLAYMEKGEGEMIEGILLENALEEILKRADRITDTKKSKGGGSQWILSCRGYLCRAGQSSVSKITGRRVCGAL